MIYMFGTGDPAIDQSLLELFTKQHPLEKTFPIGCKVRVKMDLPSLCEKLRKDLKLRAPAAMGVAQYLQNTSVEVINIDELVDEDGIIKPFVSVIDPEGYLYAFLAEDLEQE